MVRERVEDLGILAEKLFVISEDVADKAAMLHKWKYSEDTIGAVEELDSLRIWSSHLSERIQDCLRVARYGEDYED